MARRRDREYDRGQDWNWTHGYDRLGGRGWRQGLDDAMRRAGQYAGVGPRNWRRQDARIEEDINERLTDHPMLDATDIEISVADGEVTMKGFTDSRHAKRLAEEIVESVSGVMEIHNELRVQPKSWDETPGDERKAS